MTSVRRVFESRACRYFAVAFPVLLLCTARAGAQEPINAYESATQPGPGTFIVKHQLRYFTLDEYPQSRRGDAQVLTLANTVNFGIAKDWSMSIRAPLEQRWYNSDGRSDNREIFGIGDVTTLVKWRVWKNDINALDTQRLVLFGGMEWPTGQSRFSSYSFDPILGAAYTAIHGRHGFNLSSACKFTTGGMDQPILAGESTADLLRYDAAYLYRLDPAQYTADTHGAWYAGVELNGLYETNGDHEVFISPGIMYEARRWVLEMSVQLPVIQALDNRPETDVAVVLGLRFLF